MTNDNDKQNDKKSYIVLWTQGRVVCAIENTPENLATARKMLRLQLITKDITGTLHYDILETL